MEIIDGLPIADQSTDVQNWFADTIQPQIDFAESCVLRDEFNRPKEWQIDGIRIVAEYYTQNVNYNFNRFLIYGNI